LAVSVVLPTPPLVLVTVNLIIESARFQVMVHSYEISQQSVGSGLQIVVQAMQGEDLADTFDFLVERCARDSELL